MKEQISKMTMADLKATYDFILVRIAELKEKAERDYVDVEKLPAYKELKQIESLLYDELMIRTSFLFK